MSKIRAKMHSSAGGGKKWRINVGAFTRLVGRDVLATVLLNTAKGKASDGTSFAAYSPSYSRQLTTGGESTKVDLRVFGDYLRSFKILKRIVSANKLEASIIYGPDGTRVSAGKFHRKRTRKGAFRMRKNKKTGERRRIGAVSRTDKMRPPNNVIGYWLQNGTAKMRARPHIYPTQKQYQRILRKHFGKLFRLD